MTESDPAVRCYTLTEILFRTQPIRILKLDCEGAEKPILDATEDLSQVQVLCGEVHYHMAVPGEDPPDDDWLERTRVRLGFNALMIQHVPRAADIIGLFWMVRE